MIWEIKDKYGLDSPRVFSAMLQIPREKFASKKYKHIAYDDRPVSIGHGQTMSQPYTVAFMTDLLDLQGKEKVLEIGTGSGYQAAILSLLAKEVYTIEVIDELAKSASKCLKKLGLKNISVKSGKGEKGWPEKAPFDVILVTAGIRGEVPKVLFDQLKTNGTLIAPVGKGSGKVMTKFTKKKKDKITEEKHGVFHFVPFVKK